MKLTNTTSNISQLMQQAVNTKVFPGAVLLVSHKDKIIFYEAFGFADITTGQLMQKNSIFDLASLTKPLAAALCIMKLVGQNFISVEQTLAEIFPQIFNCSEEPLSNSNNNFTPFNFKNKNSTSNFNDLDIKAKITIDNLLRHTSGFPAHRPFYEQVVKKPQAERLSFMRELVLKEPLAALPNETQIYSDLGYILLDWIIETVSGCSIDSFAYNNIYSHLDINELFFVHLNYYKKLNTNGINDNCSDSFNYLYPRVNNSNPSYSKKELEPKINIIHKNSEIFKLFAATEICPWRKKLLRAEVHDDNAWSMGGIAGHAGLFGTASSVWKLLIEIMHIINGKPIEQKQNYLIKQEILNSFIQKNGFEMAAGFDTPSLKNSSSGKYFSSQSIGHLGFTGTSFWLDPVKSLIVVLLSNRVHLTRDNQKIKEFRPKIHDAIVETLFNN